MPADTDWQTFLRYQVVVVTTEIATRSLRLRMKFGIQSSKIDVISAFQRVGAASHRAEAFAFWLRDCIL